MKRYIFVTGLGRSGTSFLTRLLSGQPDVYAGHEYIGDREFWLLSWYLGKPYNEEYLRRVKSKIESRFQENTFIDVNGRLQNCVPELTEIFKPEAILHLVRDPRKVIRSLYVRRNEGNIHLIPKEQQEISRWLDEDKFYQVCWNWARTTNQLIDLGIPIINFEQLITDYNYCKTRLLDVAGIHLDRDTWQERAAEKVNRTLPRWYRFLYSRAKGKAFVEDELPEFNNWTSLQKSVFFEVCGEAMRRAGYPGQ